MYSGFLCKFNSPSLTIGRAVCTNTLPAEITAAVNYESFNLLGISIVSGRCWLKTTIDCTAKLTVTSGG